MSMCGLTDSMALPAIQPVTKVAVLLATYNGSLYLGEFLESLCNQSFTEFRVYVRDDGSTDGSLEIVHAFNSRLEITTLPSGSRLGPASGFFWILANASDAHQLYMFADQDDWWHPDKIARAVAALKGQTDAIALYCTRLQYVDAQLQHLGYSRIPTVLSVSNAAVENVATGCTVAITRRTRREVLEPMPRGFIMHDWWLYLFCASLGRVIYDAQPSIKYRQHGHNAIGAATSSLQDLRKRWQRFIRRDGGVHLLSAQVESFLTCYGPRLKPADRGLLQSLVAGKGSFWLRLRLAVAPPVARQSWVDTLMMRVLFLLGRY